MTAPHVTAAIIGNLNDENQRLMARIAKLTAALVLYASHDSWTDGSDCEVEWKFSDRVVWTRDGHGWQPAETALKQIEGTPESTDTELTAGTLLSDEKVDKVLRDIEYIIDCCRDKDDWRMKAIREAAERVELIFVPPLDTNGTPAASDAKGKDGQHEAE